MSSGEWTIRQALFCLIGSVCATLTLSVGSYWAWVHFKEKRIADEKNRIITIVQTGPEKEALKTDYLAELVGLSSNHPISVYAFDCKAAEKKLLFAPVIKSASLRRIPPGAVYIDYEVRKPVALLCDYKNVAIDKEGFIFPFAPFFSPKEIPEIYLGLPAFGADADTMGRKGGGYLVPLQNQFFTLSMDVLRLLDEAPWREGFRVKRIDVSNAFQPSLGQREIVLFTEEELIVGEFSCVFPKILRIAPKDFAQQLSNFFILRRNMEGDYRKQLAAVTASTRFAPRIIDLRIPQLAFVENQ